MGTKPKTRRGSRDAARSYNSWIDRAKVGNKIMSLKPGDIVRFATDTDTQRWHALWGDRFIVVEPPEDASDHNDDEFAWCMPLDNPGVDPEPPPWYFHSLVKDEFLTAVYHRKPHAYRP